MIAHWDEVESTRVDRTPMNALWTNLGRAAGSVEVGLKRIRLQPGEMPTPPHVHGQEEEIFFVLAGSGLSWQDGKTYEIRAGDCLVHRTMEEAHTLRAGEEGLDVLAFGMRVRSGYDGYLPRSRAVRFWPPWVESEPVDDPWQREAELGAVDFPAPEQGKRPATIVNLAEIEVVRDNLGTRRLLGEATGSELTGLNHVTLEPGRRGAPPHCHSAEEELFVVLDGDGTLELTPAPIAAERGIEPAQHVVRRGHVVSRPAGTRVAHSFFAGESGLTYLAYGTRRPNDIAYYPRSNKFYLRGVGLIGRLEPLGYWDGED